MSRIEELVERLCPDGMEFLPLNKLCEDVSKINWSQEGNHEYRYIDLSSVDPLTHTIKTTSTIDSSSAPSRARQIVMKDDVLFATTRPTQMRVTLVPGELDGQICSTGYCVLRVNALTLIPSYLQHLLETTHFRRFLEKNQTIGNYPSISDKLIKQYSVPVPPMEIQEEIVRILDSFSELETELETELEARRNQLLYYSRTVLDETVGAEMIPLGALGHWLSGKTPSMNNPLFWNKGTIPWISSKDMKRSYLYDTKDHITQFALKTAGMKLAPRGSIALVARSGILRHTLPVGFLMSDMSYNQDIKILIPYKRYYGKYLLFALRSHEQDILSKTKKRGGTVESLDFSLVKKYRIPIPPLGEQHRIVSILDKFDALVNDLSSGIPAEIEARRKQYEYYRDKLLTFKERPSN